MTPFQPRRPTPALCLSNPLTTLRGFRPCAGAATAMLVGALAQEAQQKPNVVFILADNVDYGDLGP